jgi:hypothetical protein
VRTPAQKQKPRIARSTSVPAPTGGWIKSRNLATPGSRKSPGAEVLENWFPTATGCRMRHGSQKYATLGSADVAALFTYSNGSNRRLFGACGAGIYDITTVADAGTPPAAAVSGLTGDDWSAVQFSTPGGTFLRCVNGSDVPRVFDGAAWASTPAITGTGLTDTDLCFVWTHGQRLFFVEKDSLDAWYLPVDAIGGTASVLPLGGVFNLGGSLLFGGTWSIEAGDGLSEQCVFVTTEGEVAVYQGADPSTAATWRKVGVYKIGRPLGRDAFIRAGGDLVVATDIGFIPLSQAIQRDVAALAPAAVSYPIETAWNDAVASRPGAWRCVVWPKRQMVLVATPYSADAVSQMLVANARTGAWCVFTGWLGTSMVVFGDRCFFGTSGGKVIEAEVTGYDQGQPYTASFVPLFDDLGSPSSLKIALEARAVLLSSSAVDETLSVQTDYVVDLPVPPAASAVLASGTWGTAIWGADTWGQARKQIVVQEWRSVSGSGGALAPSIQITSGASVPPTVDLVRIDLTFDTADIVT